jgi:hypothetical protein
VVLLRELTFWSARNVGATICDAASPVDEIEKLKARHAAEIERIVEVAQETVEKLVQEALEDADRRIEELTEQRNDAVGRWCTYNSCKNSTPPSLPTESRSIRLHGSSGARPTVQMADGSGRPRKVSPSGR